MEIKSYFAQDAQGNIMPSADCYLYAPGTTNLASGLVDISGSPLSNPFQASNIGKVQFGAPNGVYDLRMKKGARDTTIRIQCADLLQALNETASFLGARATAPTTRADGTPLQLADRYLNTTDQLEYLYKSSGWVVNNVDGQLLATSSGASRVGAIMQDGSIGTVQQAIDIGDNVLRQQLADPEESRELVSYARLPLSDAIHTVAQMLDAQATTPWEFANLITSRPNPSDPSTWDWTPAFKALHNSGAKVISLFGSFKLVGGLDPTVYEWANRTVFSGGATVTLDAPTGDNVGIQIGSNFSCVGHIIGRLANGVSNGNGFVRLPFCLGRWWDSVEVSNISFDTVDVQGMVDGAAMAIAGNTHGVRIGRLALPLGGQIGLLIHWAGLPNNTEPESTYHPHDIRIGSVVGRGYTEAMVTESAVYDVSIGYIHGDDNYRDVFHLGGDFGEAFSVPRDLGRVCKGNVIGRINTKGCVHRSVDYNASAGKLVNVMAGDFNLESITARGTSAVGSVGVRLENRATGGVKFADVSGFANNVVMINCPGGSDGELKSSLATAQGIIYSNSSKVTAEVWDTKNDNQAAGGGVGGVSVNATCSDIMATRLRVETNNAATHGCTLAVGSSNIKVLQSTGTVDATRFLLVDNAIANTNRVGPCTLNSGVTSYSGPDPYISLTARGNVIGFGSATAANGPARRGDVRFTTLAAGGSPSGEQCVTGGIAGSTAVYKSMANLAP